LSLWLLLVPKKAFFPKHTDAGGKIRSNRLQKQLLPAKAFFRVGYTPTVFYHKRFGESKKNDMAYSTDKRMRTLSLFSGIGGLDFALQRWCKTICYCEIDPYAIGVLTKNMVQGTLDVAPIWDNIKTFRQTEIKEFHPIECIHGGFPCQDISGLGKRQGIRRGTRSGLFYELMRIVRLAKPQIIFLENVRRLLSAGMGIVLRELSKSGYNAVWKVLSAGELGFPHRRKRIWILAYPCSKRFNRNVVLRAASLKRQKKTTLWSQNPNKFKLRAGQVAPAKWRSQGYHHSRPLFIRNDDGISSQLDQFRLKALGNAVVPQCAAIAFEVLLRECLVHRKKKKNKLIQVNYLLPKRR